MLEVAHRSALSETAFSLKNYSDIGLACKYTLWVEYIMDDQTVCIYIKVRSEENSC